MEIYVNSWKHEQFMRKSRKKMAWRIIPGICEGAEEIFWSVTHITWGYTARAHLLNGLLLIILNPWVAARLAIERSYN